MRHLIVILLLLFAASFHPVVGAKEARSESSFIHVVGNQWPPYFYREQGRMKGTAYQVVKAVLERAELDYDVSVIPWARAYHKTLNEANTLLVGLGRTTERDASFQWIVPIIPALKVSFYQLSDHTLPAHSMDDIKQRITGVERDTYGHNYLEAQSFDKSRFYVTSTTQQLINMLLLGRVDLILSGEPNLFETVESMGLDPSQIVEVKEAFRVVNYLAFGLRTDPSVAAQIRNSFLALRDEKRIPDYTEMINPTSAR